MMKQAAVGLDGISKSFGKIIAIDDVKLHLQKGQFASLLGPSGCGKTTTLRVVAGFEMPDAGAVTIAGLDVTRIPPHRRDFGMVFQNYALFPHLTVAGNVEFGLKMKGMGRGKRRPYVDRALGLVKLGHLKDRYPNQLSGGQQQRVALARAIVLNPAVLLLDEPLGALDRALREEMQAEIRQLHRQLDITALFVTHDQEEALTMSDIIAVMSDGRVEQTGSPAEIYERPRTAFVARFIGASNIMPAKVTERRGDDVKLSVLGLSAILPSASCPPGDSFEVSVRPERIKVLPASDGQAACRVMEVVYKGSSRQITLKPEAMDSQPIVSVISNSGQGQASVETGTTVTASWDSGSVVPLFPSQGRPMAAADRQ
jgi:spermidine/putrescine ABC transporter ATP-binding subunit